MIQRENYIKPIRWGDSALINSVTGIRRYSKLVMLNKIKDEILEKTNNIIELIRKYSIKIKREFGTFTNLDNLSQK